MTQHKSHFAPQRWIFKNVYIMSLFKGSNGNTDDVCHIQEALLGFLYLDNIFWNCSEVSWCML